MFRFHLRYCGPLPAKGNSQSKERIRAELAPQLADLWTRPRLALDDGDAASFYTRDIDGTRFRFIVSRVLNQRCDLHITVLYGSDQATAYQTGDIDNRVKTLLDALRTRSSAELLKAPAIADSSTGYAEVLLEDDSLVSSLSIRTEHGLDMPRDRNAVWVLIRVTIRAESPNMEAVRLGL